MPDSPRPLEPRATDDSARDRPVPPNAPASPSLLRGLSLLGVAALVFGNMVGTSLYVLPASLASTAGPLGLLAWGLTAAGFLPVALTYASLGARFPRTGGPYVFAREAFGDGLAFQSVWAYWLSAAVGNAGIVTGVVAYAEGVLPALHESVGLRFAVAQALVWGLCLLNVLGVKHGSRLQIAILFLSLTPLLALAAAALGSFDRSRLEPFAPNGWIALWPAASLVVWAYSGIESATVPAEEVRSPRTTIPRGTLLGYALATLVFLLTALAVVAVLRNEEIAASPRPIALAAERAIGPTAGRWIGYAALAAGIGTLNGWILMAGRIPLSAAQDGLFFERMARIHPRFRTPHVALIVAAAVASASLFQYFATSLLRVFEWIVMVSVLLTLVPHLLAMAAQWVIAGRERGPGRARQRVVAALAMGFIVFAMCGVGLTVMVWGAVGMAAGVPLYWGFRHTARAKARA